MAVVGEAILTAAIENLFNKLASPKLLEFANRGKIRDDIKKWEKILLKIHAVLDDAEEKQMKNRSVKIWLSDLHQLAYDVEDVLDEFATEDLRMQMVNEPRASTSKVQKLIPSCFTGLSPRSIKFNVKMASEIKDITARLEEIMTQKNNLNLIENSGGRSYGVRYRRWPETSVNEPCIYGRENDKEAILDFLLKDEGSDGNFSVVSVVGMGGIGKTTLAQLAYNDDKVEAFFVVKAWASVSDEFDVIRLTKSILQSVDPETDDFDDLDKLQVALKKKLFVKKFLIVLDDVWNESYDDWTLFCRPFQAGSLGSKILVTSRNLSVSYVVGALQTYQLNKLSYDNCLSLFTHHSLGKSNFDEYQYLEEIGKEIIKRCDGLPLAAKTLGGLLRGKVTCKDWEDVLNSKLWNLPEAKCGIIPALRLSYHYLPPHLKRCFVYCSIFPKDYAFRKEEIILLWMAEGFLETTSSEKHKEDLGDEYFEDLYTRSFFQQLSSYAFFISNASSFVMHDLIHELAQWAAKDTCLRIENLLENEKLREIPKHLRRLAFLNFESYYDCIQKFEALNELKSLRTFLTLSPSCWPSDFSCVFPSMLLQLPRLRVLSLRGYPIHELPNSIGDLKLLHHLDLSYTKIEFLPDSINTLYNLETLILEFCECLTRLCSDMGNLIRLQYLFVSPPISLPSGVGRLTSLRRLKHFVVGKDTRPGLRELKDLKNLQERLHISGLENVNDMRDAEQAHFNGKGDLRHLQLEWSCSDDGLNEKKITAQVLEKLQPCQKLESLLIRGFIGTQFPQWLGDTSLSSLVSLTFQDCKICASFPSIGQLPLLKELCIQNVDGIEILDAEFYGHGCSTRPFQSLEKFDICNLREWRVWISSRSGTSVEAFPGLRELSIRACPKLLGKLPEHLPSLERLTIEKCQEFQVSVPILPKQCTVRISQCKEVVLSSIKDHSLMSSMVHSLSGISSCMFLAEGFLKRFFEVEKLDIVYYEEPERHLRMASEPKANSGEYNHFRNLVLIEEGTRQQELPFRAQFLELSYCKCLVKLEQALQKLPFLKGLSISESPKIISLPEASLPSQLGFINIEKCVELQSLPMAWMRSSNTCLKKLFIRDCDSLTCISRAHLPANLKLLEIVRCSNLLSVLDEEEVSGSSRNTPCLEHLEIASCPSLTSLWSKSNEIPDTVERIKLVRCLKLESIGKSFHDKTKLGYLHIQDCERLKTLPSGINHLISLKTLVIKKCPGIASFPEGGFPTSLEGLVIGGMKICKSLFEGGLHKFTSLEFLVIKKCPGIASFPEGGFPTSLRLLVIGDMKICKPLFEWELHKLTSLEGLSIKGGCPEVISFPQEELGMSLPLSLKALMIKEFSNLESLSSNFRNLSCLEELYLYKCSKLKHLPENGPPQLLKNLHIRQCPLLEEWCKRDAGLYWSKRVNFFYDSLDYEFSDGESSDGDDYIS